MADYYCRRCGRRFERLEDCTPRHFTPGGAGPCGGTIFNVNNGPGQSGLCQPTVDVSALAKKTWRDRPPLL